MNPLQTTIAKLLNTYKCRIDPDALDFLTQEWSKRFGTNDSTKLCASMEILADYDYGDTESGCVDLKTVEEFFNEEFIN